MQSQHEQEVNRISIPSRCRFSASRIEDNNLELACASRTELIPRFARAKNIKGKWKYLLQASDGNVQNYQVGQVRRTE